MQFSFKIRELVDPISIVKLENLFWFSSDQKYRYKAQISSVLFDQINNEREYGYASNREIATNIIQSFNKDRREEIRKSTLIRQECESQDTKKSLWNIYYENLFNYILEDSDLDWYFESIFTAIFRLEHPEWFSVHINYYFRYAANEIANKNPEAGRIMNQIINSESSKLLL